MNHPFFLSLPLLLFCVALCPASGSVSLRAIAADSTRGSSLAVVVEEGALVHTALILPVDRRGRISGESAGAQAEEALAQIEAALEPAGSGLDRLVRLHVYAAGVEVAAEVESVLARRFKDHRKPAVTVVETAMPREGLLVMMDAVAATARPTGAARPKRVAIADLPRQHDRASHVAVQPEGPWVVVSGRAAPGDFEQALRDTMERVEADLRGVGLGFQHVVQVKTFLQEMERIREAEVIIAEFFGGDLAPPQVFTEWMQESSPAEIEVIAAGGPQPRDSARLEFVEPMSRFSRVVQVRGGRPVFISGLHGHSDDQREQVRQIFDELQRILRAAGSDMRHLVKATYYIADGEADREMNAIRPGLYDPVRAPAASKLSVRGTGREGRGSTLDMIAVTVE